MLYERPNHTIPEYEFTTLPYQYIPDKIENFQAGPKDAHFESFTGSYGPIFNPLQIYQPERKLHVQIETFHLYTLSDNENGCFLFPSWSLYRFETLRFERDASGVVRAAVIGNGKEGVGMEKW